MSETVFILGAGASRQAGGPLMSDFLDVANEIHRRKQGSLEVQRDFDLVFSGIAALQSAHSKASLNLDNIESVFAAFEMAQLLGKLGDLDAEVIDNLPRAMSTVIETTIESGIKYPVYQFQSIRAPEPYPQLTRLIAEAMGMAGVKHQTPDFHQRQLSDFTIITFNYDICMDFALQNANIPVSYQLGVFKEEGLKLLKLHGSLNWGKCAKCAEIVPWLLHDFFSRRVYRLEGVTSTSISISSARQEFTHCQNAPVTAPFIVPPTWNKALHQRELRRVWRAAANSLANAENIFVSGYSLPDTDAFFRDLYALGTIGHARLKRFWVFDPSDTDEVEARFRKLLGQGAAPRFELFRREFSGMFPQIRPAFGLTTN